MPENVAKRWSKKEIDILCAAFENCNGISSLPERLGRTRSAINTKAYKLGLTAPTKNPLYVLKSYFFRAMAGGREVDGRCAIAHLRRWQKHGLEIKKVQIINRVHLMIDMEKFWPWAEQHQDLLNFSNLKPYALGPEPAWLPKKRQHDFERKGIHHWQRWTEAEYTRLIHYITHQNITGIALEHKMGRTLNSINTYLRKRGSKLRAGGSEFGLSWMRGRDQKIREIILQGGDWHDITEAIDRSVDAAKRHCRYKYKTSDISLLREIFMADAAKKTQLAAAAAQLRRRNENKIHLHGRKKWLINGMK